MRVHVLRSTIMGLCILAIGTGAMLVLMQFKAPPAQVSAEREEKPIAVQTRTAELTAVPVFISGFGEAASLREVTLSAEVGGRILRIHPDLQAGKPLSEGTILIEIDPRPYQAAVEDARAQLARADHTLTRLAREQKREQDRLGSLDRALELTRRQHDRAGQLLDEGIGAPREVEQAEQAVVSARQNRSQAAASVDLYPIQMREMEEERASAQARLKLAELDLERCTVRAPFDLRIKTRHIEAGESVSPGTPCVTVADDAALEIIVALDSRDASLWLPFENGARSSSDRSWFGEIDNVACEVRWTERPDASPWQGTLHRVEAFDQNTRTLRVAVRVPASQPASGPSFPLVEGMFCEVRIPGKELKDVIALPQTAVTLEDNVYVVEDSRLRTRAVTVALVQNGKAYVSDGIKPGEEIIVTRLVNPLDNTLLETTPAETAQ